MGRVKGRTTVTTFRPGDRVLMHTNDGPLATRRYGKVDAPVGGTEWVAVTFDDTLGADFVEADRLRVVTVESITLHLTDLTLLDDEDLVGGLLDLWLAEARAAQLPVVSVFRFDDPMVTGSRTTALAEIGCAGQAYVVQAAEEQRGDGRWLVVRADRNNRWDF
jgi:hypothetical protein